MENLRILGRLSYDYGLSSTLEMACRRVLTARSITSAVGNLALLLYEAPNS